MSKIPSTFFDGKKYIAFFDLDGTLLNRKLEITPKTIEAIKNWQKKGNYFVISTGRPDVFVRYKCQKAGLRPTYIISFNGAIILNESGELLFESVIDTNFINEIAHFCNENKLNFRAMQRNNVYHNWPIEQETKFQTYLDEYFIERTEGITMYDHFRSEFEPRHKVLKFIIYIERNDEKSTKMINELINKYGNEHNFAWSLSHDDVSYLEITRKNADKGLAVKFVADQMNISLEQTISFGDSGNDEFMLKTTHYSIAPKNATKDALRGAKYQSPKTNDEDFIVDILK